MICFEELPLAVVWRTARVEANRPRKKMGSSCRGTERLRPSTDWMRPTHITEDNLLYSKSSDLNVNLIQKRP